MEAQQFVWKGSIPLQIHLHESEVTTLPPPPPLLVHFRGYPGNVLIPCEGEDSVKWSFINSLKEAAYVINGNCKNVMNMSQPDQLELWRSVSEGDLEAYRQVSTKLKLGLVEDEYSPNNNSVSLKPRACIAETELGGQARTVRIPVRLYVWNITEDFEDLEDAPQLDSWDKISYINRPVEIVKEDGKCFTLSEAIKTLLPELFCTTDLKMEEGSKVVSEGESSGSSEHTGVSGEDIGRTASGSMDAQSLGNLAEMKFVRIQGIEPRLEIPFSWVANNLMFPEYFLHICICLRVAKENGQ